MDYITQQIEKVKEARRHPAKARNQKIREQYATGSYTVSSLGRMYKLSKQRISFIINNPQEVNHEA